MILVQHICTFLCFGCCRQNLFFHFLAFVLWYQLILCFSIIRANLASIGKSAAGKVGLTLPWLQKGVCHDSQTDP